jgi:hypothetical protein
MDEQEPKEPADKVVVLHPDIEMLIAPYLPDQLIESILRFQRLADKTDYKFALITLDDSGQPQLWRSGAADMPWCIAALEIAKHQLHENHSLQGFLDSDDEFDDSDEDESE